MKRVRITVNVDKTDIDRIQSLIKKEYPRLKSVSAVFREALKQFLRGENPK